MKEETPESSPEVKLSGRPGEKLKVGHKLQKENEAADLLRKLGNDLYDKGRLFEALVKFNDALCFSIPGSESMGKAYANRSAVYLDLKRFKNCLRNIKLARENGYPPGKFSKLDDREARCKQIMGKTGNKDPFSFSPFDFFKLSYAPNPKVPFLAKCLEMSNDKEFGPHLVTNFNLKSGDFIAVTDGALKFIDPLARLHRCSWCVGDCLLDLYPCPGCPQAMYCSEDCMNKGKLDFHYKHCKLNPSLYKKHKQRRTTMNLDDPEVFITEKVYSRLEAMFDGKIENCSDFLALHEEKAWNYFDFDWRKMDKDVYEKNLVLISLAKHQYRKSIKLSNPNQWLGNFEGSLLESVRKMLPMDLILSKFISVPNEKSKVGHSGNKVLFPRIVSNFVGKIMSPLQCFTTVSCVPNAEFINVDNKLVLMVLRPIKAGEKISVSLGGITFVHYEREARQLLHTVLFDAPCKCVACRKNWKPIFGTVIKLDPSTNEVMARLRWELKTKDVDKALPEAKPGVQQWIVLESIVLDAKILAKPAAFYP